jgi:predicted nucleic acid-binding protein
MRAVSNTSPILNLASIGRLELLKSQFSTLWIPDAVVKELTPHPDPIAQAAIQTAVRDQWLRIATPGDSSLLRLLLLQLHQGEAEAIALASELNADIVLMDEQEGRQLASKDWPRRHWRSWYSPARQAPWGDSRCQTRNRPSPFQSPLLRVLRTRSKGSCLSREMTKGLSSFNNESRCLSISARHRSASCLPTSISSSAHRRNAEIL